MATAKPSKTKFSIQSRDFERYLMIILALILLTLLGFGILRSANNKQVEGLPADQPVILERQQ